MFSTEQIVSANMGLLMHEAVLPSRLGFQNRICSLTLSNRLATRFSVLVNCSAVQEQEDGRVQRSI